MYINGYDIGVVREPVKLWADDNCYVTTITIYREQIKLCTIKMSDDTTELLIRTLVSLLDNPGIDNNNPDYKSYRLNTIDVPLYSTEYKYSIVSFRDDSGINLTIIIRNIIDNRNNKSISLLFDEQQMTFFIELLSQKRETIT